MNTSAAGRNSEQARVFADRGANQTGIRERNERLILALLRQSAGLAKADIARNTGLSAQTVSRLIGSLEADGLILRGEPIRGRVGQPSVPLSLNPGGAYFFGLKVGRRSVEIVMTDFLGRIVDRAKRVYAYPVFDEVLEFAIESIASLTRRAGRGRAERISGLGIAMPFHLWNWAARIGVSPDRMAAWETRDLQAELADLIELPVFLQNDATAACNAELVFGRGPHPPNFACFYIAFFIGGGLVLNGSLYSGAHGNAAGFGPLVVPDVEGGTKPLIDLASLSALEQIVLAEGVDPRQIWATAEAWDIPAKLVEDWSDRASGALAHAILATQTMLDLDAVLIDGWLPRDILSDLVMRVSSHLDGLDITGMYRPEVSCGTIGADARTLGAASLPLSARFLTE